MYKKEIFLEIDANLHQPIQSMEADSNSRAIRFYLTSNYAPLNLKDKKVIFKAVKPDSTDIVNDCEIIDVEKGIVETKVTKQLNAVPGRVNCQLSVIGANDYVLKTKKFVILVDSKLTESGIISSREYKTLENALSEVHEINKNFEQVNAKINEVATKGTTVEVIEEVTKEEIERQIADGTITHLMIEDGSVTPEKTSFYDEIATQKNLLKNAEFDYMGNNQNTVKKAIDSSIDWLLGEVNTAHHEGQHITATDTIEGHAKSAILKGNTLVNLSPIRNKILSRLDGYSPSITLPINMFKSDVYYIAFMDIGYVENATNTLHFQWVDNNKKKFNEITNNVSTLANTKVAFKFKQTLENPVSLVLTINAANPTDCKVEVNNFMIIEYQQGMENWDIPYFEGMRSVKMPVLTTTGKNLFNMNNCYASPYNYRQNWGELEQLSPYEYKLTPNQTDNGDDYGMSIGQNVSLKKGVTYTVSFEYGDNNVSRFNYFNAHYTDGDDSTIKSWSEGLPKTFTFTPTRDIDYVWFCMVWGTKEIVIVKNIQIEQSSQVTPFEPHKSNILTVNEEVELRGVGDVQDELNLMTGELTQRIGEIVLDGSETWIPSTNFSSEYNSYYTISFKDLYIEAMSKTSIADKLVALNGSHQLGNKIGFYIGNNDEQIAPFISVDKMTVSELTQWLKSNPITIQYRLATESVKTVDLSDNVVYSYDEVTHYDCSSEEGSLVPTLSIDVPTNLPALVSRQRATIENQKTQIQTLEIENEQLIEQNQVQDEDIALNQDAINFMLFTSEMLADDNNKTKGANTMAAYLANQILKGKLDYSLVVSRYPQFKEDIDTILILEGEENLIK